MTRTDRSQYPDDETRIREENRKLRALLVDLNALLDEVRAATGGDVTLLSADARAALEELHREMMTKLYGLTDEQANEIFARLKAEAAERRGGPGA